MPDWLTRLRELVWPAVAAAVLAVASVGTALISPERSIQAISLGLAGITMALLATRE
jgi:hypothetical protein